MSNKITTEQWHEMATTIFGSDREIKKVATMKKSDRTDHIKQFYLEKINKITQQDNNPEYWGYVLEYVDQANNSN
jgi:hypothetical protein